MPEPSTPDDREWVTEALKLWARGKTVQEIANQLGRPVDEVAPELARGTHNAIDLALRGGGWK